MIDDPLQADAGLTFYYEYTKEKKCRMHIVKFNYTLWTLSHSFAVNLELIHDLWVPNIFIYNLKTFQVIDVLSKLAGLWINNKKEVYYRFVLQSTMYHRFTIQG